MADRPLPPNTPLSIGTMLRLMPHRTTVEARPGATAEEPRRLDPLRGKPYTVERFPALRGQVLLIGYDGEGDAMLEFRVPERMYTTKLVQKMVRTIREFDPGPHLSLK